MVNVLFIPQLTGTFDLVHQFDPEMMSLVKLAASDSRAGLLGA